MTDDAVVKDATQKCPHCGTKLLVNVKKELVTEPTKAVYETVIEIREDPQGTLPLEEPKKKKGKGRK